MSPVVILQHTNIHRPQSSPTSQVQYALRIITNGGQEEFPVQSKVEHMSQVVHTFLFLFVVGKEVSALSKRLVSTAILEVVSENAGSERCGIASTVNRRDI